MVTSADVISVLIWCSSISGVVLRVIIYSLSGEFLNGSNINISKSLIRHLLDAINYFL